MGDAFLSIRGRLLLNVEALNMTESVGNYVKHRRVPVIIPEKEGFTTYFVPAISGESIAHGFQKILVEESIKNSVPICKLCRSGVFLKSTRKKVVKEAFDKELEPDKLEEFIIKNCFVEDVGGFLYAEEENIKRSSNFFVGYMIPVKESLGSAIIESQLHSRYALGTPFMKEQGQMIYYVEIASAVYTFSFDFDTTYIGRLTFSYESAGKDVLQENERKRRLETVFNSIKTFIVEQAFGAKKTRFLPIGEWDSIVIAVSDKPWIVTSPFSGKYIENTIKKKEKINYNTNLYIYKDGEGNFEETVINAIEDAKNRVLK
ncbi:MAG: type I-A CRISPR-associated protein Cas7/Csa2 [Candidatus Bathyarchaeia archaeon]|nr:type I-A CRISPR-associated protein Cas7/Csa2 [Candidatus Bathyarchaeota archaeon]